MMNEKLSSLLQRLEQFGNENDARTASRSQRMLNIAPDTGEFLVLLIRALKAKRVLEIGASNGYSTLWLAHAVQPVNGLVTTLEIMPHKAEMARANFAQAELTAFIQLYLVDAGNFLEEQPPAAFEFIFLDSDREQYLGWWPALQRILAPGGLIVVDNAVSHAGEVALFSQAVRQTEGYITSLAPVGNGELLILKEGQIYLPGS
jgi:predicted O-methyltransferase YrrM